MRRLGQRFVFVLIAALLLAQQGLALHGLSHGLDSLKLAKQGQTDTRGLPADRQCDLCLTYAQVASGAAVSPPILVVPEPVVVGASSSQRPSFAAPAGAYRPRAPPRVA